MILPIVAYGDAVLRKKCADITKDHPNLDRLIADMFETMYNANGVGLAAPQVGFPIRLFIVDGDPFAEKGEHPEMQGFKKIFINAHAIAEEGREWPYNEGCLSIPKIREDVNRMERIKLEYLDEKFQKHTEEFEGLRARVVQHEYDHIEGKLFTDRISALRRQLLKGKLSDIAKGNVDVDYKMKFPLKK